MFVAKDGRHRGPGLGEDHNFHGLDSGQSTATRHRGPGLGEDHNLAVDTPYVVIQRGTGAPASVRITTLWPSISTPSWSRGTGAPASVRITTSRRTGRDLHRTRRHRGPGLGEDHNVQEQVIPLFTRARHRGPGLGEDHNQKLGPILEDELERHRGPGLGEDHNTW